MWKWFFANLILLLFVININRAISDRIESDNLGLLFLQFDLYLLDFAVLAYSWCIDGWSLWLSLKVGVVARTFELFIELRRQLCNRPTSVIRNVLRSTLRNSSGPFTSDIVSELSLFLVGFLLAHLLLVELFDHGVLLEAKSTRWVRLVLLLQV